MAVSILLMLNVLARNFLGYINFFMKEVKEVKKIRVFLILVFLFVGSNCVYAAPFVSIGNYEVTEGETVTVSIDLSNVGDALGEHKLIISVLLLYSTV